jgi:hypothetical protein
MANLAALPVLKVVYTTILLGLIAFLVREVYGLWWDRGLYVGRFEYFADGKSDDAQAKAWCRRELCRNSDGAISGMKMVLDQAARSIVSFAADAWVSVFQPSTLRMVI